MDPNQFKQFVDLISRNNETLMDTIVQAIRAQNRDAQPVQPTPQNPDEKEVREIKKNFKCEHYIASPTSSAENFVDTFEAQCRMRGLNSSDTELYVNAKRDLFLCCLSPDTHHELKVSFTDATTPFEQNTYKTIIDRFIHLYTHKTTRFKALSQFWNCIRKEAQSFEQYANELRAISRDCDFENLDRQLRDRFATGIRHQHAEIELRQRWPDLKTTRIIRNTDKEETETMGEVTFKEVFEVVQSRERAENDVLKHNTTNSEQPSVNKIQQKSTSKRGNTHTQQPRKLYANQCKRCGYEKHTNDNSCPATNATCNSCRRIGHYASCCIKTGRAQICQQERDNMTTTHTKGDSSNKSGNIHKTSTTSTSCDNNSDDSSVFIYTINHLNKTSKRIDIHVNGIKATFDYDSGASHSIIDEQFWKQIGKPALVQAPKLMAYGSHKLQTLGQADIHVTYNNNTLKLPVIVMKQAKPFLFGLPWCEAFNMPFPAHVYSVTKSETHTTTDVSQTHTALSNMLVNYSELFSDTMGRIKDYKVKIHLKHGAQPKRFDPRYVKFGIQNNVENEINRLVIKGVLTPVDPNETPVEWATPTVNVPKRNGDIRICGDFSVTINPCLLLEKHPVPLFDNLRRTLAGGERFSKIDLKDAYLQFEVHPESQHLLTISTHMGYYKYSRLPFGIANAPAIFQRYMEKLLSNINSVAIYFDDIAITGKNDAEHMQNLKEVLTRLQTAGFRIKREKCTFFQDEMVYLGHRFNKNGIFPTQDKLDAITNASPPTNIKELRSFMGLVNFYERFIPNLHGVAADLHTLSGQNQRFKWTNQEQAIFDDIKFQLLHAQILHPYYDKKDLYLTCDASDKGIGAVLSHRNDNGIDLPIAFASRKLSGAQLHYGTIDKEALAIVFGVQKFDRFLAGRFFTLVTDHEPLTHIFGRNRNLPKLVNNRLIRWALLLNSYSYDVEYISGKLNIFADFLSRMPSATEEPQLDEQNIENDVNYINKAKMDDLRFCEKSISTESSKDTEITRVINAVKQGWTQQMCQQSQFQPFLQRRDELSVENNILMWQGRMVLPTSLRTAALQRLHSGHPGIVAMRAMARYYIWWPKLDSDIEDFVKRCQSCQENRNCQPEVPLYSWNVPARIWERIHIDFAGPFKNKQFLVIVDALSKWVEIYTMTNITTNMLEKVLSSLFARYGVPQVIVSDNGTSFTSQEFKTFCEKEGVNHITSSPYHPKTNGLAERFIQTFKRRMKSSENDHEDLDAQLNAFLFSYRNTPHATTGKAPAELFLGRRLPTIFDNAKPSVERNINRHNLKSQLYHDRGNLKERHFNTGDNVWVRTDNDTKWKPGTISQQNNRWSYSVCFPDQNTKRRHADAIRERHSSQTATSYSSPHQAKGSTNLSTAAEQHTGPESQQASLPVTESTPETADPTAPQHLSTPTFSGLRRSTRQCKAPLRLNL